MALSTTQRAFGVGTERERGKLGQGFAREGRERRRWMQKVVKRSARGDGGGRFGEVRGTGRRAIYL